MSIFANTVTLDSYFDRIFYINLKKDTLRNEAILNQFKRYCISNYERVTATELNELPDTYTYRNFIKNDPQYQLNSIACRASHLNCIQLAKQRKYQKVLILEDDIVFLENPNLLLKQNYAGINDWNLLYFGGLVEPHFRNQIVCAHAYGVKNTVYDDILNMAEASGMEIDNFYAKILQHMSYNYNSSGKYNVRIIQPFNKIVQNKSFHSNIQTDSGFCK